MGKCRGIETYSFVFIKGTFRKPTHEDPETPLAVTADVAQTGSYKTSLE